MDPITAKVWKVVPMLHTKFEWTLLGHGWLARRSKVLNLKTLRGKAKGLIAELRKQG